MNSEEYYKVIDECMGEEETSAATHGAKEGTSEDTLKQENLEASIGMMGNVLSLLAQSIFCN